MLRSNESKRDIFAIAYKSASRSVRPSALCQSSTVRRFKTTEIGDQSLRFTVTEKTNVVASGSARRPR